MFFSWEFNNTSKTENSLGSVDFLFTTFSSVFDGISLLETTYVKKHRTVIITATAKSWNCLSVLLTFMLPSSCVLVLVNSENDYK